MTLELKVNKRIHFIIINFIVNLTSMSRDLEDKNQINNKSFINCLKG